MDNKKITDSTAKPAADQSALVVVPQPLVISIPQLEALTSALLELRPQPPMPAPVPPPPAPPAAPTVKAPWWKFWKHLEFTHDAVHFYKIAAVWIFILLGAFPDLYNLAVSTHVINATALPPKITFAVNVLSFLGLATRLIKRRNGGYMPPYGGGGFPGQQPPFGAGIGGMARTTGETAAEGTAVHPPI